MSAQENEWQAAHRESMKAKNKPRHTSKRFIANKNSSQNETSRIDANRQ